MSGSYPKQRRLSDFEFGLERLAQAYCRWKARYRRCSTPWTAGGEVGDDEHPSGFDLEPLRASGTGRDHATASALNKRISEWRLDRVLIVPSYDQIRFSAAASWARSASVT
jgi:hypothetical protein